ncbi:MAG: DUF402 domain-containing protein [Candidatus Izemoplasmatales bacterium]|jgi:hypothetical protein|nr:DUF402 domain-containing protein [Candidatus Izemoplasmatales bacterium]
MALKPLMRYRLQSYKHDKSLHRIWDQVTILFEDDEKIVVANRKTKVIEGNGRIWYTREPSVSFFFKDCWYNVIAIIKPLGISYYCNLSSPVLYDEEAIKYIDYDLDIMVLPDFSYTILDQNEYLKHQRLMQYPEDLCDILKHELDNLIKRIEARKPPFEHELVQEYYQNFLKTGVKKNVERPKN